MYVRVVVCEGLGLRCLAQMASHAGQFIWIKLLCIQVLFDDTKHPHARWHPRPEALAVLRLLLEFADVFLLNEVGKTAWHSILKIASNFLCVHRPFFSDSGRPSAYSVSALSIPIPSRSRSTRRTSWR